MMLRKFAVLPLIAIPMLVGCSSTASQGTVVTSTQSPTPTTDYGTKIDLNKSKPNCKVNEKSLMVCKLTFAGIPKGAKYKVTLDLYGFKDGKNLSEHLDSRVPGLVPDSHQIVTQLATKNGDVFVTYPDKVDKTWTYYQHVGTSLA